MKRLRDFPSISAFLSEREIDELQAAVDARREARALRTVDPAASMPPSKKSRPRSRKPAKTARTP